MIVDVIKRLKAKKEVIIATDFDDTLVKAKTFPEFGEPTPWFHIVKKLKCAYPNLKLILFTCREGKYLESALRFCHQHWLFFDAVNSDVPSAVKWKGKTRKPFAHIYVDDRNVTIADACFLGKLVK